jgi:hypothetical protein
MLRRIVVVIGGPFVPPLLAPEYNVPGTRPSLINQGVAVRLEERTVSVPRLYACL